MGPENYQPEIPETSDAHPSGGITTGGGFSNYYVQPEYQKSAVAGYVSNAKMPVGNYNATGMRGYPDVALMGHMYQVRHVCVAGAGWCSSVGVAGVAGVGLMLILLLFVLLLYSDGAQVMIGGTQFGVSGTSASTPVVAGMVNLWNTKRLKKGQSVLGFLNPLLYKHADVFNDMVGGNNKCTAAQGGVPVCCLAGFDAIKGWDPLTGLGSIDFSKAAAAFVV